MSNLSLAFSIKLIVFTLAEFLISYSEISLPVISYITTLSKLNRDEFLMLNIPLAGFGYILIASFNSSSSTLK